MMGFWSIGQRETGWTSAMKHGRGHACIYCISASRLAGPDDEGYYYSRRWILLSEPRIGHSLTDMFGETAVFLLSHHHHQGLFGFCLS